MARHLTQLFSQILIVTALILNPLALTLATAETTSHNPALTISFKSGKQYEFTGAPYTQENAEAFASLSPTEQKEFLERRETYLRRFVKLMHHTRLAYGTGIVTYSNIKQHLGPSLELLTFSLGMFYEDSKEAYFTSKNKLAEVARKISATRAGAAINKMTLPAVKISKAGLKKSVELIKKSNEEVQLFHSWLVGKIYPEAKNRAATPEQLAAINQTLSVAPPVQELAVASLEAEAAEANTEMTTSAEPPARFLARVKDRSEKIVFSLAQKLDELLWAKQKIVVRQNEFVVVVGVHMQAMSGLAKQVTGGVPHGLGIKLGFNRDTNALVFEIYHESEVLTEAVTPTSVYGVSPKIGFALLKQVPGEEMRMREGSYVYPTAVAISPSYTGMLNDYFALGWSISWFNAPLSFLSDFFWYNTHAIQRPLLRATLAPFSLKATLEFMQRSPVAPELPTELNEPIKLLAQTLEQTNSSSCADELTRAQ